MLTCVRRSACAAARKHKPSQSAFHYANVFVYVRRIQNVYQRAKDDPRIFYVIARRVPVVYREEILIFEHHTDFLVVGRTRN